MRQHSLFFRLFGSSVLAVGIGWPGCGSGPVPGVPAIEPVFILSTELLTPPVVGLAKSYRPEYVLDIRPEDPSAGQAVGFVLTVAAARPESLRSRLRDTQTGTKTELVKVDPPAVSGAVEAMTQLSALARASADLLAAGRPVFAILPVGPDHEPTFEFPVAFLLPAKLLPEIRTLECYISSTAEGGSMAGDRIDLVPEFFHMAVIGDSILWGNGLNPRDKFTTLVAERIELATGKRVITRKWAVSGARIVPGEGEGICGPYCFGEAPRARTSITTQAELIEKPETVDLIIMDGCINDVGVGTILDPATTAEELTALTEEYCGQEMAVLLDNVRSRAPGAAIVVTGYYPIVSPETDPFAIGEFAMLTGEQVDETDDADIRAYLEAVSANSEVFYETSSASLAAAVSAVNATYPEAPPMVFVDPGFGPANAVFAPERWLWSLTASNAVMADLVGDVLQFFPEDSTLLTRISACLERDVVGSLFSCLYVSLGHPNPAGARAYARGVIDALEAIGVLPADVPPFDP